MYLRTALGIALFGCVMDVSGARAGQGEPALGPSIPGGGETRVAVATPPAAPPPDSLATARARGAAGFYAARDASARAALFGARDDGGRLEALKLLADTASRTGDWTSLDVASKFPPPPGPGCACDELAWHVALVLGRLRRFEEARAWLALVPRESPEWADAQYVHAQLTRSRGAEPLAALVQARRAADPHARAVRERAVIDLARLRCAPGTYTEATALLDTLPRRGARALDVTLARAWCVADAGRTAELAALLPALDAGERKGAWVPSLPLLRAVAAPDAAARRRALEASRDGYGPVWEQIGGAGAAVGRASGTPDAWRQPFGAITGLPPGLVARMRASEMVVGFEARFALLDREAEAAGDAGVRADLAAERKAASKRAAMAVSQMLESYAREVGWLRERAIALLSAMDAPPPEPADTALPKLTAQSALLLRGLARDVYPRAPSDWALAHARLATLEMGTVPTDTTIETLRAALAASSSFPGREAAAWTLALTLLDADRVAEAEVTLKMLIAASPTSTFGWRAHALLGDLAFARGDFVHADAAYAVATGAPDRPLALYSTYRRAWCAWARGRPSEASATLAQVIGDPATPAELGRHARAEQARLATCRKGLECGG